MAQLHPRFQRSSRLDDERRLDTYICSLVEPEARVIDLGCGTGELLEHLIRERNIQARGVEISSQGVKACIEKGLSVYQGDLDDGFEDFDPGVFDTVILNLTLSMLHNPDLVLQDVARIGKRAIITFYNAGYLPLRKRFFETGEMADVHPEAGAWYQTPQIHPFSVNDFENLCRNLDLQCHGRIYVDESFQILDDQINPQDDTYAAVYQIGGARQS